MEVGPLNQSNALKSYEILGTKTVNLGNVAIGGQNYPITTTQANVVEGSTVDYFDSVE
jgi:hypothetical protein